MKTEPTAKDGIGSCLIFVGISLGLLTGVAFLLFLGAAVGVGMGGGLKNLDAVITGFNVAIISSLLLLGSGIYMRVRSRIEAKRADSAKELHNKARLEKPLPRPESTPEDIEKP